MRNCALLVEKLNKRAIEILEVAAIFERERRGRRRVVVVTALILRFIRLFFSFCLILVLLSPC